MSTNGSSKWRKFSDYEIRISDDGTKYVCPVPGSAAVFYDPMAKPDKLAIAVTNAAEAYLKDMTDESVVLDLVRSAGLPGFALGLSEDQVFPFGGSPAAKSDLLLAGRGPEYGTVFSGHYAEKYDDICAWLESIGSLNSDSAQGPDCTNLKSMAEYCISSLKKAGKLRPCAYCGKLYYTEDPESETCSKACEYQYSLSDSVSASKKRYIGHLISGG